MNNYWEETLNPLLVTKYQINPEEVVYYKKCVNRDYGQIWFEVKTKNNAIHKYNLAGH
jgi:hypothetical protein